MGWPTNFAVLKHDLGLFWMPAAGGRMWWLKICASSAFGALHLAVCVCHLSLRILAAFWSPTNTRGQACLTPSERGCVCEAICAHLWCEVLSVWEAESWAGNCADASALFLVIQVVFVLYTLNFLKQLWKPQLQCLLFNYLTSNLIETLQLMSWIRAAHVLQGLIWRLCNY